MLLGKSCAQALLSGHGTTAHLDPLQRQVGGLSNATACKNFGDGETARAADRFQSFRLGLEIRQRRRSIDLDEQRPGVPRNLEGLVDAPAADDAGAG